MSFLVNHSVNEAEISKKIIEISRIYNLEITVDKYR